MTQALLGLDYLRQLLLMDFLVMLRGMVTQKDILLLLIVLILIGKRVVFVYTIAVRWSTSAPAATIGRLARTTVADVAACTSLRAPCTRMTTDSLLSGSPCAPSQNKIRFI